MAHEVKPRCPACPLLVGCRTGHQHHIGHRCYKMFLHTFTYKTNASKRHSEPSTYSHILNIRVHRQTSAPFPPTFFTWNLCTCLRRLLIFHFHHTSRLACMFKTDLWVSKHLILSSEGAWFYEIWLHCQTAVVPVPNGRWTKPAHWGASAILFSGQHYPLQKTPQTKATWWRGKPWQLYLIPLCHSGSTSINHSPPAPDPNGPLDAICHRPVGADMLLKIPSNLPV